MNNCIKCNKEITYRGIGRPSLTCDVCFREYQREYRKKYNAKKVTHGTENTIQTP